MSSFVYLQIPVVPAEEPTTANPETCRYKNYDIPIDTFKEAMGKKCFEFLFPKFNVERAKDKCMILTKSECNYWNHCIDNAEECCRLQKESEALELKRNETNSDRSSCNHTWDGFSCWKRTPAGKSVTKKCPAYVSFPDDNGKKIKHTFDFFVFLIFCFIYGLEHFNAV